MKMQKKILTIDGMTCINCQNRIEQALKGTAGIHTVNVSYSKGQAEVEFDSDTVTLKEIAAIIQNLDYTVVDNGRLVCQNCGNVFTMDSVGKTTGGCNPMNISYKVVDGNLTIKTADIDKYADKFTTWKGPVE